MALKNVFEVLQSERRARKRADENQTQQPETLTSDDTPLQVATSRRMRLLHRMANVCLSVVINLENQ
jgi:hypothetical protein